jgi:hypothetical protein
MHSSSWEPLDHFSHNKHTHKHFNIWKLSKTMKHKKHTQNSIKANRYIWWTHWNNLV